MRNITLAILSLFLLGSCEKDKDITTTNPVLCNEEQIVFDDALFEAGSDVEFTIAEAKIVDDCLSITYFTNSCESAEHWNDYVVGEENWESDYVILGLNLETNINCETVYAKELHVDLQSLKVPGENTIHIQLKNFASGMFYRYEN